MKPKKQSIKPVAAIGTVVAVSIAALPIAQAGANPFGMTDLGSGYQVAAEGKCGEGKCGDSRDKAQEDAKAKDTEGKCGNKSASDADKSSEGKCGEEGKCGTPW